MEKGKGSLQTERYFIKKREVVLFDIIADCYYLAIITIILCYT